MKIILIVIGILIILALQFLVFVAMVSSKSGKEMDKIISKKNNTKIIK